VAGEGDLMSTSMRSLCGFRHRPTARLALILAGVAAWTSPTTLTAAGGLRTTVTVRVYQTAGLPFTLEQRALAEAKSVLRSARVDVRWRECTGLNPPAVCDAPLEPSELLLRVMRKATPRQDRLTTLGNAFVARRAGGGVLATVYFDQIASLAEVAGTDVAVLLGRVVAHELGHLMMQTSAHAPRGLMRPNWTLSEVRRNSAADWAFTAWDVAAMRLAKPEY
jgi:hypothetical protein